MHSGNREYVMDVTDTGLVDDSYDFKEDKIQKSGARERRKRQKKSSSKINLVRSPLRVPGCKCCHL